MPVHGINKIEVKKLCLSSNAHSDYVLSLSGALLLLYSKVVSGIFTRLLY